MNHLCKRDSFVAVTGATGLIGHQLLARLLRRGIRCIAIVRDPQASAARLAELLRPMNICVMEHVSRESLVLVRGDMLGDIEPVEFPIDALAHIAGCTRFHSDANGDPQQTNVQGTARVLEWATRHGIRTLYFTSTAYAGGASPRDVHEAALSLPEAFNNEYEYSKWSGEQLCATWAHHDPARRLTIVRPSIVVGEWATGRTTSLNGLYLAIRAAKAVADMWRGSKRAGQEVPAVTIAGRSDQVQNIVPVDYVADMLAAMMSSAELYTGYFNLVHPSPPTNEMLRRAVAECLQFPGFAFADRSREARTMLERVFDRTIGPIFPYVAHSPRFSRGRAASVEASQGIACPSYDHSALLRVAQFAIATTAHTESPRLKSEEAEAARYFELFLPDRVPQSNVARLIALNANVRFTLCDVADGAWLCQFRAGRLEQVIRSSNGVAEDFGYRLKGSTFLKIVSAQLDPREAFLNGSIELVGDIERALKMAMVLHEFSREFPFHFPASATTSSEPRHDA